MRILRWEERVRARVRARCHLWALRPVHVQKKDVEAGRGGRGVRGGGTAVCDGGWAGVGGVRGVAGMQDGVVGGVPQVCGGNGACNCAELVVDNVIVPSVLCGERRGGGGR